MTPVTSPYRRYAELKARLPLIAILRGLRPSEVVDIGQALYDGGFMLWEVPLNSPDPLDSIAALRAAFPDVLVGAGTVLSPAQVRDVHAAGGQLVISPNADPAVISATVELGLISLPGILTPTEAFTALEHGAHGLKLFPAELASPAVVKALLAVLPQGCDLFPVGGIAADTMSPWVQAGATGFGIGSSLYKPGKSAQTVREDARAFAQAWQALEGA
ncbi:2-dehydro-3-deoxy-6-phosphogalactonate aldolase [Castellaniella ginsengisoli]|uniref:2-dehydro-3-deoxy-6-phosphogalactonate aldolase n=1 Tax=Castellaniella ginsengisoli TaxID=546114 RepID=A0AB39D4C5_9BURK